MRIIFSIKRRPKPIPYSDYIVPIGSIVISLVISSFILFLSGVNPILMFDVLSSSLIDYSTLRYSIPLILCGIGLAIAYKANIWNIGSEGQILAGAAITSGLALYVIPHDLNPIFSITILYIAGFTCGALLGLLAGILRAKFDVNEVLSTLMLNYIMMQIVNYLVYGPWRGVREYGYPRSDIFPKNVWIPQIPRTTVHYPTFILSLVLAILMYIVLFRTKLGFEIRVAGANPEAARYSGINLNKVILVVMFISGGLAGLAGVGEVAGIYRQLIRAERVSAGFGYTAIIVAWLGKLNPIIILLSGYFIGALISMSYKLQIISGISYGSINIVTGILLASLISLEFISRYKPVVQFIR